MLLVSFTKLFAVAFNIVFQSNVVCPGASVLGPAGGKD
jgi:hypothetical protein